jgi:hypothetical protein
MDDELGLLREYGLIIMGACLVGWGIIYTFLANDYGPTDE